MDNRPRGPKGPLPNRWLKCPRRGQPIADKFVPFKTPLDHNFNELIEPQYLFTPDMFISSLSSINVSIGMWVDLTNTNRFYNSRDIESKGIKYLKIRCVGRDERPTPEQTNIFIHAVDSFIEKNPSKMIAVHCTHGFNRTGFLICAYLVEIFNWDVSAAVQVFTASRPPGIYKEDYLKELFTRFGDPDDAPQVPPKPDWCFEEEEDDEGRAGAVGQKETRAESEESDHHNRMRHPAVFMDGVSGVTAVTSAAEMKHLTDVIRAMTGWKSKDAFPGAQPVSMTIHNLIFLSVKPYMVSWKADGTRYLMLILEEGKVYFMDRKSNFFKTHGIKFPRKSAPNDHLYGTLLDGEMVLDDVKGQKSARYLIYDVVKFENHDVGHEDFRKRISCIRSEIIDPREKAKSEGRIDRSKEPFGIRWKPFYEISATNSFFKDSFRSSVGHEMDGLIFQPVNDPYVGGTCDTILKWKPHTLNSIDFKLMVVKEQNPGMLPETFACLMVIDENRILPFHKIKITKSNSDLKEYHNQIVECTWDNSIKNWKILRIRTDKPNPNSLRTAQSVWDSIMRPVTKDSLLKYIDQQGYHKTHGALRNGGEGQKRKLSESESSSSKSSSDGLMLPPPKPSTSSSNQPPTKFQRSS